MKKSHAGRKSDLGALMKVLALLDRPSDCARFLEDLCTPTELEALADRWEVARMVAGGVPYREIAETTGVSTATIARVSRCISGEVGGYRTALEKVGEK
jgi:TrpR-related protein YerC/YecD